MTKPQTAELGALGPGLEFRLAVAADSPQLATILNESILDGTITAEEELKGDGYFAALQESLGPREGLFVLSEDGEALQMPAEYGGILGYGAIKLWSDRSAYRYTCETSVYLRHSLRGRGYGSMIKRALIDQCRAWGYRLLMARTTGSNTASIETNLRFGYEIIGRQRDANWLRGAWEDVVLLQLVLEDVQPA
jgi:phosphinothricin acetyltransferase